MAKVYLPGIAMAVSMESFPLASTKAKPHTGRGHDRFNGDTAFASVAALENLRVTLESFSSLNKTPSHLAINAAGVALEAITQSTLGKKVNTTRLSPHTSLYERNAAVKLALESVGENIKLILLKIVAWIKAATQKVSAFLVENFKGAVAKARKAEQLNEAAIKARVNYGNSRASVEFEDTEEFVQHLGDVPPEQLAKQYARQMAEFTRLFSGGAMTSSVGVIRKLTQEIHRAGTGSVSNEDVTKLVDECITHLESSVFRPFSGSDGQKSYALGLGQAALKLSIAKSGEYKSSMQVALDTPFNDGVKLKALTVDEVVELSNAVITACKAGTFPNYSKFSSDLHALSQDVAKLCDRILAKHAASGGEIASLHMLKQIVHAILDLARHVYTYSIRISGAVNAYCLASLKALSQ
jgi:hypothetical protein